MIFKIYDVSFKNKKAFFDVLGYSKAIPKAQVIKQYGSYEELVMIRSGIIEPEKIKEYLENEKKMYEEAQCKKHDSDKNLLSNNVNKNEISQEALKFLIFVYNSLPDNERERLKALFLIACPEGNEKIIDEIRDFKGF